MCYQYNCQTKIYCRIVSITRRLSARYYKTYWTNFPVSYENIDPIKTISIYLELEQLVMKPMYELCLD